MNIPIPSMEHVITILRNQLLNPEALADRFSTYAIREYYGLLVTEAVEQLLSIPVDRLCLGLSVGPIPENEEYDELVQLLAHFFDKKYDEVASDIIAAIKTDVGQDIRLAKMYRFTNKLH